jgi:hypothetical protein
VHPRLPYGIMSGTIVGDVKSTILSFACFAAAAHYTGAQGRAKAAAAGELHGKASRNCCSGGWSRQGGGDFFDLRWWAQRFRPRNVHSSNHWAAHAPGQRQTGHVVAPSTGRSSGGEDGGFGCEVDSDARGAHGAALRRPGPGSAGGLQTTERAPAREVRPGHLLRVAHLQQRPEAADSRCCRCCRGPWRCRCPTCRWRTAGSARRRRRRRWTRRWRGRSGSWAGRCTAGVGGGS